jgi:Icc-related predicted phosphoesterase
MKLVVVSDTHGRQDHASALPDGDVLIHCGDLTMSGTDDELVRELEWLAGQQHETKLLVPGNHDFGLEDKTRRDTYRRLFNKEGVTILVDDQIVIDGIKFWGYPWIPNLRNWAFYGTDPQLQDKLALIPDDTDILISHGPPQGAGDLISRAGHVGCPWLRERIRQLSTLKFVFCGHIHEGYGFSMDIAVNGAEVFNASACNEYYYAVNKPLEIEICSDQNC